MSRMSEIDAAAQLLVLTLREQYPEASEEELAEKSFAEWASVPAGTKQEKLWSAVNGHFNTWESISYVRKMELMDEALALRYARELKEVWE